MTITARVSEKASHIEIDGKSYPVAIVRAALAAPVASAAPSGEREKFEADIRTKCHSKENADEMLEMNANGFYNTHRVEYMWLGWQAAIAHQPPKEALTDKGPRYIAEPNEFQTQILHAMYRSAQRGDSVERMHFDVCAIIAASAPNKQLVAALQQVMRPYGIYDVAVSESGALQDDFMEVGKQIRAALAAAGEKGE